MNKSAQQLGRLAAGKPKKYSPSEIAKRTARLRKAQKNRAKTQRALRRSSDRISDRRWGGLKMQVKRPKRKDCVQRLAERRFAEARGSAAVEGFMRGLLMKMGLSREGAELVRDSLNTAEVERDTAMKTLRDISASPRNRGARRYARATIAFLDALREEKAKQPNAKVSDETP